MLMTVRRGRGDRRRALLAVVAFVAPLLLAGCTSTPETSFEWGVRERVARHHTPRRAVAHHQRYVRRVAVREQPRCICDAAPTPTPRPTPAWYKPNTAPADSNDNTYDSVQSSSGDASFVWPMKGRILSPYGARAGGGRNDGINIAATEGEPIRAAADGTVTYSGNDLKSYGNLTLIKHDGGYVTAYAHAERFVVRRGEHVAKGQVIGYAGETGDVRRPQLHFEIRRGIKPVNPRPLLGPLQVASR